jgi:DNA adenine methylase
MFKSKTIEAKPFLKWAGGKTQLIADIERALPSKFTSKKVTYIEPFVGSGAVLFWMLNNFPNIEHVVINDINADLINAYKVIVAKPKEIISVLEELQKEYHSFHNNEEGKKEYYYQKRDLYNARQTNKSTQAALFIFLNRTCFNGLYRVNRSNLFNVPIGSYKTPTICDAENIYAVSELLKKAEILNTDYEATLKSASHNSFFYFDPPYKPLSGTSSFNSYSKDEFDDRVDPFTGSSTTGIAANLSNRRFLGIDQEEKFLQISKNRKLEIENEKTVSLYKQKISGFNDKKELTLFLAEEPKEPYSSELKFRTS